MVVRSLVVAAVAAGLLAAGQAPAKAASIPVSDPASFAAALASAQPGDVIQLANTTFPRLTISQRYATPVTVEGSGSTVVGGFSITGARNVTIEGLTVSLQGGASAASTITNSLGIRFDQVKFIGASQGGGAGLDISSNSSSITISNGEFTLCRSFCLKPNGTAITVTGTSFHDCYNCDMVRGGGSGITLSGDQFLRALKGAGGTNHNDLIQIMGGGPWTITDDLFGPHEFGAAQVYVNPNPHNASNPIHDITIASNIFNGSSGYAIRIGVGSASAVGRPTGVKIVNNTIMSGRLSSILLLPGWASSAPAAQPIVANNILALQAAGQCALATWSRNLNLSGSPCPGDIAGQVALEADGVPTTASPLIVGRANPQYAPATDYYGHPRSAVSPTIGAIELPSNVPAAITLVAPRTVTVHLTLLRRSIWRLAVPLQLRNATALVAQFKIHGRSISTATHPVKGLARYRLLVSVPKAARRAGSYSIALRALGVARPAVAAVVVRIVA